MDQLNCIDSNITMANIIFFLVGCARMTGGIFHADFYDGDTQGMLYKVTDDIYASIQEQILLNKNLSKNQQDIIPSELQFTQKELKRRVSIPRGSNQITLSDRLFVPTEKEITLLKFLYKNGRGPPLLSIHEGRNYYASLIGWINDKFVQVQRGETKTKKLMLTLNLSTPRGREKSQLGRLPKDLAPILYQMLKSTEFVDPPPDPRLNRKLNYHDFPLYEGIIKYGTICYYSKNVSRIPITRNSIEAIYWTIALFEVNNLMIQIRDPMGYE